MLLFEYKQYLQSYDTDKLRYRLLQLWQCNAYINGS